MFPTCRDVPLYLEWAPGDILSSNPKSQNGEKISAIGEEHVKKVLLEQSVEGIPEEEIDPDKMEVRRSIRHMLSLQI